jgi:FRG domain
MESREGNWQEFEAWLQDLRGRNYRRGLIFRGQADSDWRLETTLERSGHPTMSLADYYALIVGNIGPSVSAFSSMQAPSFNKTSLEELSDSKWLSNYARLEGSIFDQNVFPGGEHYEYVAYLRHHRFPSPLLDWSKSPYVAAFFAFRDAAPKVEKRSIFAYCDRPEGTYGGTIGEPMIQLLVGHTRTPRRHFFQQSIYTVCESANTLDGKWQFDSHQKVFDNPHRGQDFLGKFDIPSTEREKIMGLLDQYNLNAFSLFESEESLLETLWLRANGI